MMEKILNTIMKAPGEPFLLLFSFAILFSSEGLAYGASVWSSVPQSVTDLATIFGNVLWLCGCVLIVIAASIFLNNDEDWKRALQELADKKKTAGEFIDELTLNSRSAVMLILSAFLSLFAIGSGFWFSGTCGLLFVSSMYYLFNTLNEHAPLIKQTMIYNGNWADPDAKESHH